MSEILDPTNSDWDYARLLMHDADCEVYKMRGRGSDIPDGETFVGKLDAPEGQDRHLRPGEMAFFTNDSDHFAIGRIERIEPSDAIARIIVTTRNGSLYSIEQIDMEKYHRKMALLYLRRCYLGFADFIYDRFYDGGKSLKFSIGRGLQFNKCGREVVVYNSDNDQKLLDQYNFAKRLVEPILDIRTKVRLLAQYIAETMGDTVDGYKQRWDIVSRSEENVRDVGTPNLNGVNVVKIGDLEYGVCRHRSAKFKYFADRLGIRSHLVRGIYGPREGAHAWNTVEIPEEDGSKTYYVVDVMNNSSSLIETSQPECKIYRRKGTILGFDGGVGERSVIANEQMAWNDFTARIYGE